MMEFTIDVFTENITAEGILILVSGLLSGNTVVDALFLIFVGIWVKALYRYVKREITKADRDLEAQIQKGLEIRLSQGFKFD